MCLQTHLNLPSGEIKTHKGENLQKQFWICAKATTREDLVRGIKNTALEDYFDVSSECW